MRGRLALFDPLLVLIPLGLMAVGTAVIYALTAANVGAATALRQLAYVGVSAAALAGGALLDYRAVRAWAPWIFAVGIMLLVLVRFFGKTVFGAALWIQAGPVQFQPGEAMKAVVAIAAAAALSRAKPVDGRSFAVAAVAVGLPAAMVLLQPDLGTALVLLAMGAAVFLHAALRGWQRWTVITVIAALIASVGLSFAGVRPFGGLLKPYQKDRLTSFIYPERDRYRSGYNVQQSKIAVGAGGLTGRGLGNGSQSQLDFLPVAHADFIFAGIGEAWGLAGSLAVLAAYLVLMTRLLRTARLAKDEFGMLLVMATAGKILAEVAVNAGMNIGLMPVTGIPLPFLSYGGTALITNAVLLGLAQSVATRHKRLTF